MKKQILIVGGGDTFENDEQFLDFLNSVEINIERSSKGGEDWKPWLRKRLGENYQVIIPQMPNKNNAKYDIWKIWLEKFIPHLEDEVVLIGHSLGAAFMAKYLSENIFPVKISGVFLVSGVFNKGSDGLPLYSFVLPEKISLQTEKIFLYHSKDDPVVPFEHVYLFKNALPSATLRELDGLKHINQEVFEELAQDILSLK